MIEILGNDLEKFFKNSKISAGNTYKGEKYEVWTISEEVHKKLCDMSEEEFANLAENDAWWRSSKGSVLGEPNTTAYINGEKLTVWKGKLEDEEDDKEIEIAEKNLTDYLVRILGVSLPRNVCACCVDLAKYNYMTLGELFKKYEG